jgi:hypothetical protein
LALFNSLSSSSRRALFYLDFYLESDAFGLEGLQDRTGRHFEGKSGKEKGREKCDADWFAETTRNFERALSSREPLCITPSSGSRSRRRFFSIRQSRFSSPLFTAADRPFSSLISLEKREEIKVRGRREEESAT